MADLYGVSTGGGLAGNGATVDFNRKAVEDLTAIKFYGGKQLTFLLVDFVAAANGELNQNEAVQAVMQIIGKYATIVIRGDLFDTNTQMVIAVETPNDSLDWDGNGATTLAQQIDDEINALGATYGDNNFDMTAVTCTVKTSLNLS